MIWLNQLTRITQITQSNQFNQLNIYYICWPFWKIFDVVDRFRISLNQWKWLHHTSNSKSIDSITSLIKTNWLSHSLGKETESIQSILRKNESIQINRLNRVDWYTSLPLTSTYGNLLWPNLHPYVHFSGESTLLNFAREGGGVFLPRYLFLTYIFIHPFRTLPKKKHYAETC